MYQDVYIKPENSTNFKMHFQAMDIIIDCSISSADRERLSGDMVKKEPGIMIISEIS